MGRLLRLTFLAAGLAATAAQVTLLRELVVDVAGDEAAIGVGLAAWLFGIAFGARTARKLTGIRAQAAAAASLCGLALAAPTGLLVGRLLAWGVAPPPGELPGLGPCAAIAALTLLPGGFFVGRGFTALALLASSFEAPAPAIARLYAVESLGSLLGGLWATASVASPAGPLLGALGAGAVALLLASPAARAGLLPRHRIGGAAALLLVATLFAPTLDLSTERVRFAGTAPGIPLAAAIDTPYQHLVLAGRLPWHLYASGLYAGSFPDPYGAETLAHAVACLAPNVDRVLSHGGLERGALRFLLKHPVREIVLVEPDARGLAFLRDALPREDRAALDDPRVRVVTDDIRRLLSQPGTPFDLILLLEPDPVTLRQARLQTLELFRAAAARLSPQGVLILSVRTAPATLAGDTAALAGSLFGSLSAAFPVVKATPGPETLLIAGHDPRAVVLDPRILAERWRSRGIETASFAAEVFPALYPPDRVADLLLQLRQVASAVPPSTDDRPVSFQNALARRQSLSRSPAGRALVALGRLPSAALVLLALAPSVGGLLLELRRQGRRGRAAVHAVAATGAAGMGWSLLLLLSYQTAEGALYGHLGLLTALFMLGLALGAAVVRPRRGELLSLDGAHRRLLLAAAAAAAFAALLAGLLPGLARLPAPLLVHGSLLLLSGAATGALFPAAAALLVVSGEAAGRAASRLEVADHIGAALAALLAAVVLVPSLGLSGVAWLLTGLTGLALLRLVLAQGS